MAPSRSTIINVHLATAAFFLPFAIMFLVTGALYTVGIKGSNKDRKERVPISTPLTSNELAPMVAAATEALDKLGVAKPSGAASVRKSPGGGQELFWGGVARDVTLRQTEKNTEVDLVISDATAYRKLVQLHKGKGSNFAKAISIIWAVGLAVIFLSGLSMVFASPKFRRIAYISGVLGTVVFIAWYIIG